MQIHLFVPLELSICVAENSHKIGQITIQLKWCIDLDPKFEQ
jgi:hypothetical protein